ncbi:MAG: hypothetical protein C0606_05790 [Hyphomicrobiales bacterium]|nr:MAG: hypothetical protein C0606_05790 [Hyphomicrobiales bacterium]
MIEGQFGSQLAGKDEAARVTIAGRVGALLTAGELAECERQAAEILARELVTDAIERVRRALAEAVRHADHLPKDIALKIAHDVDSIACPFLRVTEVFSEKDWQQLILTISRGARIAVAQRRSLSEGIALALAELGDTVVAEALVGNTHAPTTTLVCHAVIDRNEQAPWVLDKLAERDGLSTEIVIKLIEKVSAAARAKLAASYNMRAQTDPMAISAGQAAILQVVRELPEHELLPRAVRLRKQQVLTGGFLLRTLQDDAVPFCAAALSVLSGTRMERVRSVIWHEDQETVIKMLRAAGIDPHLHDAFWRAIEKLREAGNGR